MMWQTQTTIEYPFALRPASIEEAGLFYLVCFSEKRTPG